MKKFLVAAGILLSSFAQADILPRFGLQVGISLANLNPPSGITSASNYTGFAAGISVELPLSASLSIQPEALFVQRGANLLNGATPVSAQYNSVEVPVFLKLAFGDAVRPNVFIGPDFIFNISSTTTGGLVFSPNAFDLGAAVGAGVDAGPISINLRYVLGFLNIGSSTTTYQSRGFLALIGLRF